MSETVYRVVLLACNVIGGIAAGLGGMYALDHGWRGPAWMLAGVVLLAVPPGIALLANIRRSGMDVRDSALLTLTELCHVLLGLPDECDARVTLLRVDTVPATPVLRAVARGGRDGKVPRSTMTIHQGVAGLCYRSRQVVHKPDVMDFTSDMRDLGFTDQDIRQFQSDRKSYLCLPVVVNGAVVAVVSCDSKTSNVFDQQQEKTVEKLTPFFGRLLSIEEKVKE
ncbi:MAG: GAF domain-containing protein [Thermoanaerobaculia bacterium]|nr:GAF domain-containing protein [Thermoanaerobaculia bacterium]